MTEWTHAVLYRTTFHRGRYILRPYGAKTANFQLSRGFCTHTLDQA